MKTLLKLGVILVVLLLALTTCTFNQISVGWVVNGVSGGGGSVFVINYDVWNSGKYDLEGVKLHFTLYLSGVGYFTAVSPSSSLSQNQYISQAIFAMNVPGYSFVTGDSATIEGVDMDKPKN